MIAVIDLGDRKVIGWALSAIMKAIETVIPAFEMAQKNWSIIQKRIFQSLCKLQYTHGRELPFSRFMVAFSDELHREKTLLRTITRNFHISEKLFWKLHGTDVAVENVTITGFLSEIDTSSKSSFWLTDQLWMIMKEVFEKRLFILSKNGLVWNLSKEN